MNNIVIDIARIAAIILMRGLVLSVIWVIAYLIWRLIFAKKGKKRPWLLDSLSRLVIITVVFALIGIIGYLLAYLLVIAKKIQAKSSSKVRHNIIPFFFFTASAYFIKRSYPPFK